MCVLPWIWQFSFIHWVFFASHFDPYMVVFHQGNSSILILLYVDDIIFTSKNTPLLLHLRSLIVPSISYKGLWWFSLLFRCSSGSYLRPSFLSQTKYLNNDLLVKLELSFVKPVRTPFAFHTILTLLYGELLVDPTP